MPASLFSIDGLNYEYNSMFVHNPYRGQNRAACSMHYKSRAGSRNGNVVMQPLKGPLVGTNRVLSAGDIKKMQIIGQCSGW